MSPVKKIVIIGPESTGKSTLCELLAQHYQTEWCNEFAREYLITNGTHYTKEDLLAIAKGQLALEDEVSKQVKSRWSEILGERLVNAAKLQSSVLPPMLFVDTDMYVMKVWSEYVFGVCDFLYSTLSHIESMISICSVILIFHGLKMSFENTPMKNHARNCFRFTKIYSLTSKCPGR